MENETLTGNESEGQIWDDIEAGFIPEDNAFEDKPTEEVKKENENSSESSTEKNENEEKPSQEGEPEKDNTPMEENLPFHKHPRFKEIIEENKKFKDEIEQMKQDVSHQFEEIKKPLIDEIPESFKKLYGDSPEVWSAWKTYLSEEKSKMKDEFFAELKAETAKKEQEAEKLKQKEDEAQEFFKTQFAEIEATEGKIDRNAIAKIIDEYHPIDPVTSLYDIKAAYKIYKQINKPDSEKSAKRKEIADTTTSKGNSSTDQKNVTWDSIHKKGWGQI